MIFPSKRPRESIIVKEDNSLVNESIQVGFSTARSRDKARGTCVTRVCNKTELQCKTGKEEKPFCGRDETV